MFIDQILNDKGREVISVRSDSSLLEAAQLLDKKRIGAVVAIDDGEMVIGVLSERDIARQVARKGAAALEMNVAEAMTRDVVTIDAADPLDRAMRRMTDRRIRHLPVLKNKKLVGVISIGDLVKWKIADVEAEAQAIKSYLDAQF